MNEFSDSAYLPDTVPHRKGVGPAILGLLCLASLLVGCVIGFMAGTRSRDFATNRFSQITSTEKPAQLTPANSHEGIVHSFDFPANWALNNQPGYYLPDQSIVIETPGGAQWVLGLEATPIDPDWTVDRLESQYRSMLGDVTSKPFESTDESLSDGVAKWGEHLGAGVELHGTYYGHNARVRIFSATLEQRSFSVVEFFYTPLDQLTRPGFEQIENSFEILETAQSLTPSTKTP